MARSAINVHDLSLVPENMAKAERRELLLATSQGTSPNHLDRDWVGGYEKIKLLTATIGTVGAR
jgi:hypothetical protein